MSRWWIAAVAFAVVALVLGVGSLWMSLMGGGNDARIDSFSQHCSEASGHIYKPDRTSWCVSADGRFVEVYP